MIMFQSSMILFAAIFLLFSGGTHANDIVQNVRIVDVETGLISELKDIEIRDGTINSIKPSGATLLEGSRVLDGQGGFVLPGLWDSHVHVFSSAEEHQTAFKLYLLNGVTGIRDMGAMLPLEKQKRIVASVEDGTIIGPRVVLSGAWIDASPGSWPGMFLADTPVQGRERVREIVAQGWAAAKTYSMLAEDTYLAIADESKKLGIPLVGHIPESVTLQTVVKAGQNGIEHFGRVTAACSTEEKAMVTRVAAALKATDPRTAMIKEMATHNKIILDTWNLELCKRILTDMASARLHISPTLIVSDFYVGKRPNVEDIKMRTLPAAVPKAWRQPDFRLDAMTDELRALADQSIALSWKKFKMAYDAGVPILASTDSSFANPYIFHGYSLLDELDRYVEAGLTPREALSTATVTPPRFFRLSDQDRKIAAGRRADLLILDSNPFDGLSTLRKPRAVIANGRIFDRSALQALQEELEIEAAK
jgi:hypothetical protein